MLGEVLRSSKLGLRQRTKQLAKSGRAKQRADENEERSRGAKSKRGFLLHIEYKASSAEQMRQAASITKESHQPTNDHPHHLRGQLPAAAWHGRIVRAEVAD